MSENVQTRPIACTLTDEQEADRSETVQRSLVSHYLGAEERADGYTVRFNGTDDALLAVAGFTADERLCCSFAEYTIEISPPYEETRLTITGPEGTKELFADFVDRLETEIV